MIKNNDSESGEISQKRLSTVKDVLNGFFLVLSMILSYSYYGTAPISIHHFFATQLILVLPYLFSYIFMFIKCKKLTFTNCVIGAIFLILVLILFTGLLPNIMTFKGDSITSGNVYVLSNPVLSYIHLFFVELVVLFLAYAYTEYKE